MFFCLTAFQYFDLSVFLLYLISYNNFVYIYIYIYTFFLLFVYFYMVLSFFFPEHIRLIYFFIFAVNYFLSNVVHPFFFFIYFCMFVYCYVLLSSFFFLVVLVHVEEVQYTNSFFCWFRQNGKHVHPRVFIGYGCSCLFDSSSFLGFVSSFVCCVLSFNIFFLSLLIYNV